MKIIKSDSHNKTNGPEEYFTGKVEIESIYNPPEPS